MERILNYDINDGKGRVLNYGASGANSDYAVETLPFYASKSKLDYILWANFINEIDVIFTGPKNNYAVLSETYGNILGNKKNLFLTNKVTILLHRVDKTIKKYSLFYWCLKETTIRLKPYILPLRKSLSCAVLTEQRDEIITKKLISLAVTNYKLNFLEAKDFADRNIIEMILIRLPVNVDMFRQKFECVNDEYGFPLFTIFMETMDDLMIELSNQYKIPLINVHEQYINNEISFDDLLCDTVHQNLEGNIRTAEFINDELKVILK